VRLQKILAQAGVASRRKCEELIAEGRVTVNGEVATIGTVVDVTDGDKDSKGKIESEIKVDGVIIAATPPKKTYIALHKPIGVVTTAKEQFGRPSVMDFVPRDVRLFPVGRLDYGSSGLIFLTDDGDWANMLMHPSHEIVKTYVATVRGTPDAYKLKCLRNGIVIEGKKTAPAEVKVLTTGELEIKIREGRNRQIRKMCEAIGHPVIKLQRVAIGDVKLGDLPAGKWRHLDDAEISRR